MNHAPSISTAAPSGTVLFPNLGPALRAVADHMPSEVPVPIAADVPDNLRPFLTAHAEMKAALERQRQTPGVTPAIVQAVDGAVGASPAVDLFLISFLYKLDPKPEYLQLLLHLARKGHLDTHKLHQIYWQARNILVASGTPDDAQSFETLFDFYLVLAKAWINHGREKAGDWIPPEARKAKRIALLTNQLMGPHHGPSAGVYLTAKALREMGKEVLLVNTADMPSQSTVPMFEPVLGDYDSSFTGQDSMTYQDGEFDFLQCPRGMPDPVAVARTVQQLRAFNPYFILSMGGASPTADLATCFTTVVTLPVGHAIPIAASQVLVASRVVHTVDRALIARLGFHKHALVTAVPRADRCLMLQGLIDQLEDGLLEQQDVFPE